MTDTDRYHVVTEHEGGKCYIEFRNRDAWGKRTAQKHAREYEAAHGEPAWIEKE